MNIENQNKGWISIYRSIYNHWLAPKNKPFTNLEAWLFILVDVNHTERKVLIGQKLYNCKRGESLNSLDTWARRFNWSKSKVRRFFNLLESDNMITRKTNAKTTHLTVCNYDSYQDSRHNNETQTNQQRNANDTQTTLNNNDNNLIIKKSIYKEVLNSKNYLEVLQKNNKINEKKLLELFNDFWKLNYEDTKEPFNLKDVKTYFSNKIPYMINKKTPAKKTGTKERVINR